MGSTSTKPSFDVPKVAAAAAPSGSDAGKSTPPAAATAATTTTAAAVAAPTEVIDPAKAKAEADVAQYRKFREELLAFSLGEASFDYAERLLTQQPDNPAILALVGETAWMYEKLKVAGKRDHWIDRLDLLQRGIDVSRKCIKKYPDYGPCYTNYTMLAVKSADNQFYWKWMKPLSLMYYYNAIIKQSEKACALDESFGLHMAIAELNARIAPGKWYSWYRLPLTAMGLPNRTELLERSKQHHLRAAELHPGSVENAARLAMVLFELGELNASRRWYVKARDELTPEDPSQDIWQTVAHTALCTHFEKHKWNAPFA